MVIAILKSLTWIRKPGENCAIKLFSNDNNKFFELSYETYIDATFLKYTNVSSTQNVNEINTLVNLEIPIYKGFGRIELINDAWHGVTILEFLRDNGFFTNNIAFYKALSIF